MIKKKAFIIGVTGQDGAYLSKFLIKKKFTVYGYTRSKLKGNLKNLSKLNILNKIIIKKYNQKFPKIILNDIKKIKPDHIYYFSGQSSVGKSFSKPIETYKSNINLLFLILEFIRLNKLNKIKIYNSSSTDCFGEGKKIFKNEKDLFFPHSPYGNSKSFSFWLTKYYRENYNLNSKSGILSNHESPLRKKNFVLKRIIDFIRKRKDNTTLKLGNILIYRDWGWAPEYVEAIYKINNSKLKKDYIVGTGKIVSLKYIVNKIFKLSNINKKYYKANNSKLLRLNEIKKIGTNPAQIYKDLKWRAKLNIDQIIKKLLLDELY